MWFQMELLRNRLEDHHDGRPQDVSDELWRELDRAYLRHRLNDSAAAAKAGFLEEVLRAGLVAVGAPATPPET